MNPTLTTLLCAAAFLLGRWSAREDRTRELDRQLAEMEREKGRRRGAGEQALMGEVL